MEKSNNVPYLVQTWFTIRNLLNLSGNTWSYKLHSMSHHVVTNHLGQLLIKPTEQYASYLKKTTTENN